MKKIFVFPGQGSQNVGMGKSLVENFPLAAQLFEEANDALHFDLRKLCFEGPEADLKLTHITQPAILTHSVAAYRVLSAETGVKPDYVAGHSLGEFSALVAAQVLSFADAVVLVNKRGKFMQEAVPVGTGGMAALIGGTEANVKALCDAAAAGTGKACEMANLNGGGQIVISGHKEAIDEAVRLAGADPVYGIAKAVLLSVSAPFHSSLMKRAEENMRPLLAEAKLGALAIPYIANVDAKVYKTSTGVADRLTAQICGAVRWEQSMQLLSSLEVSEGFEVGPGRVLSGLMRRISRDVKMKGVDTMEDIRSLA
ncbi:MAG: [acyl-carrier-protein] S-malonyltransferase [Proteobacteria bacterium]|nr:MAG: [acyl-carrier-protein] S-malonyltransferase [Pseudomonadota bacterium]